MNDETHILFHEYGTQLRIEADDTMVLNVLCGRVGQYGVEFPLNGEEYARYKSEGDEFVKQLSLEVQKDPDTYAARGRTC